jgi:superfamily I DNA/RNA helicase
MERLLAASQERHASVFTVMRHTDVLASFQPRTAQAITEFVQFLERTRAPLETGQSFSLARWTEEWLKEIAFYADLQRSEKNPEIAEARVRNVQELVDDLDDPDGPAALNLAPIIAHDAPGLDLTEPEDEFTLVPLKTPEAKGPVVRRLSRQPQDRLAEFLEDLSLDQEREEDKEAGDAVTLITMHAAKGLEYPHVQIVGLEDGLLPHSRSKVEGTLDEERRLFYVAITRARLTLRISHCGGRKKYGQVLPCHPSPFLKELPPECVENAEDVATKHVEKEAGGNWFDAMRAALE